MPTSLSHARRRDTVDTTAGRVAPRAAVGTRADYAAGALAGTVAGLVMATFMMGVAGVQGRSVWTNPDLIAAMWMGPEVADGRLTAATAIGFATHMATSALIGLVAVPFIVSSPYRWRARCWRRSATHSRRTRSSSPPC